MLLRGAIGLVFGLVAQAALAGELYKCTSATGKIEFQDRPCAGKATSEKLVVQPNAVAPTDTGETAKKLDALNKRLADRAKADDKYRETIAAQNARHAAECRRYAEEIVRQSAWLNSISQAVRQSAANEIAIQRARQVDYGC